MMVAHAFAIFLLFLVSCASATRLPAQADDLSDLAIPCFRSDARKKLRSQELQDLVNADQADRQDWSKLSSQQLLEVSRRDVARRKRVGEIFGEGCFETARDYAAAALVFQHGDRPDHFLQTFLWSKRGVELGDIRQRRMMALGLDRYLVNIGHKQLFASQASTPPNGDNCYCLDPVEPSFPQKFRTEYLGRSIEQSLKWVNELNDGKGCAPAKECEKPLKPSPRGTVPGFW
jgi:hypothetical protein